MGGGNGAACMSVHRYSNRAEPPAPVHCVRTVGARGPRPTKKTSEAKKFIIATEDGIFHQIRKMRPDAELIQAPNAEGTCGCSQCPYMKLNTLEKIRDALKNLEPKIELNEDLRLRAHGSLDRMMKISRGESVSFS